MDLWVWIAVFIAAWLLEALAGAAKRRQQGPPRRAPGPVSRVATGRTRPRDRPATPSPAPRRDPQVVVYLPEPPRGREGVSAEVDVRTPPPESTRPTHVRVSEKYGPSSPDEIGAQARRRKPHPFALRPGTLRRAIVWSEVLGPPKSER